jgi:hypothetical protein
MLGPLSGELRNPPEREFRTYYRQYGSFEAWTCDHVLHCIFSTSAFRLLPDLVPVFLPNILIHLCLDIRGVEGVGTVSSWS